MHLNIPPHGESPWHSWLRNIWWGLTGVFGPELVVFIAWKQYLSARALVQILQDTGYNDRADTEEKTIGVQTHAVLAHLGRLSYLACMLTMMQKFEGRDDYHRRHQLAPWTVVHGFYAGMGGIVFQWGATSEAKLPFLGDTCRRVTLTPRGVVLLADCGLLPVIDRKNIEDKSKADGLAKCLACTQAGWMAVQVVGRLIAGVPVTLLEVNTLGHVLCALIIYVLWWNKPRLIQEPTILEGDWVEPVCAYMYISSAMSGNIDDATEILGQSQTKPELASLAYFPEMPSQPIGDTELSHELLMGRKDRLIGEEQDIVRSACAHSKSTTVGRHGESENLDVSDCLTGAFGLYTHSRCHPEVECPSQRSNAAVPQHNGTARPLQWVLAAEALRIHPAIRKRFQPTEERCTGNGALCLQEKHPEELVTLCSGNWATRGLLPGMGGLFMGIILWSASMGFGAIHAAAWNNYFPSLTEKWLWRSSSIHIMASGLIWTLINLVAQASRRFDQYWERLRRPTAPWINSVPLGILSLACGIGYAFARVFLVIEAFVSIRRLPVAAYETPDWTQEIPHL